MDDDARFMARTPAGEPYELCKHSPFDEIRYTFSDRGP